MPRSFARPPWTRGRVLASLAALVLAGPAPAPTAGAVPSPPDLSGTWTGSVHHRGESAPLEFRFEPGDGGEVRAFFSVPALHGWDFPIGAVQAEGDSIAAGPFRFAHDPAAGTLRGTLPALLLPIHRLEVVLERGPPLERPPRPELTAPVAEPAWTFDTGARIWGDVACAGELVYAGNDDGALHAIDARTGERRWVFRAQGRIRARPIVSGSDLYVPSDDGMLYRLDARRGSLRWKLRIEEPIERLPTSDPRSKFDFRAAAVCLARGSLYLGTHDGRVIALDPRDGRVRWQYATGGPILSAPAVAGTRLFAGSYDGRIHALDADSGRPLWSHDVGAPVTSTPVPAADRVIVGHRGYDLLGLDAATGTPVWSRYVWFSWIESTAAIRDGIAYHGSSDAAKVFAVEAAGGRPVWETDVRGISWGEPAVTADHVFACVRGSPSLAPHQGALVALDRETGSVIWRFPVGRPAGGGHYGFGGSPAVCGERVFAGGLDGRVYAFDRDGPRPAR